MSERTLLHTSFALVDADAEPIADAGILIEGRSVVSVGPFSDVRRVYPLAQERDAAGLVALPGLVDAHSHGRGLAITEQGVRDGPLELFLAQLTACTPLDPYDDAFVASADLVATGVTAAQVFFHSHATADAYRAAARATAAGLSASRLDFELVLGFTDRDEFVPPSITDCPAGAEPLCFPERDLDAAAFLELFDTFSEENGPHVTLGPVAPQWCSQDVWDGVAARARGGTRVHTHLLESRAQRMTLHPSPVETLHRAGVLNERLSAAHAVWLAPDEIAEVAAAGAALVHCPGSNRKLAGGTAPVRSWLDAGVHVALGFDSYARADPPDAFDELRLACEGAGGDLSPREALKLATLGGAYAIGRPDLGRLAPGSAASIVLLPVPDGPGDLVTTLLGQATRHDVVEVWASGSLLVEQRRLKGRRAVEQARARLRSELDRDASVRRRRLAAISALEPWLAEVFGLDAELVQSTNPLT